MANPPDPQSPSSRYLAMPRLADQFKKFASLPQDVSMRRALADIQIPPDPLVTNMEANRASEFHKRLMQWISSFDAGLDEEFEVGVRLISFGQTLVFHLRSLGYYNPSLISFQGQTDAGDPVELIQHVSQISILLMKLPRKNPDEPKRPIGFQVGANPVESGEASTT